MDEQLGLLLVGCGDGSANRVRHLDADGVDLDDSLKLYFISDTDDPNFERDLLVGAENPDKAVEHWQVYYDCAGEFPAQVFLVPVPTESKALRWHHDLIAQTVRGQAIVEAVTALGLDTEICPACREPMEETVNSTSRQWECACCGRWIERRK